MTDQTYPSLAAVRDAGDVRRVCPSDLAITLRTVPSAVLWQSFAGYGECEDCGGWFANPTEEVTLYLRTVEGISTEITLSRLAADAVVASSTLFLDGTAVEVTDIDNTGEIER